MEERKYVSSLHNYYQKQICWRLEDMSSVTQSIRLNYANITIGIDIILLPWWEKGLDQGLGQSSLVLHHVLSADRESVVDLVTGLLIITPEIKWIICKVMRLITGKVHWLSYWVHCLALCRVFPPQFQEAVCRPQSPCLEQSSPVE